MSAAGLLRFDAPVALIGGGAAAPDDVADAVARAGAIVAADSGADHFTPGGEPRLDALIGDMDSVRDLDAWRAEPSCRVLDIAEQDSTDFEKCLYSVDAPLFLAAGFVGARLDHTLGALHALLARPERRVAMIGASDVAFLARRRATLALEPGARVSIVPLTPCRGVFSEGLRWPIDGLDFALGRQSGTSNEAIAGRVRLGFDRLGALILIERRFLDAAIAAVQAAEA